MTLVIAGFTLTIQRNQAKSEAEEAEELLQLEQLERELEQSRHEALCRLMTTHHGRTL